MIRGELFFVPGCSGVTSVAINSCTFVLNMRSSECSESINE